MTYHLLEHVSQEESVVLNTSLVCSQKNMGDDSFDDNVEVDNIEELSIGMFIRIFCRIYC